ncbi:MAG: OmpA family protein [Candidatus Methylacidiphilales bacterium]|nr:OmpA family protein [Candidatus Methylacidiphilales bacterium]
MSRAPLRVFFGLSFFGLLCLGLSSYALLQSRQERDRLALLKDEARNLRDGERLLQGQVGQLRKQFDERETQLQTKEEQLARTEEARLTLEKERAARLLKDKQQEESARAMQEKLASVLKAGEGSVFVDRGRITIRLANQILFRSGEAQLLDESRSVLTTVAALLNNELAGLEVFIEGHTDNVPVSDSIKKRFASNWDLSAARAGAAALFLQNEGKVDPLRLCVVGRADTRPIAPNDTPANQALNRRIDIRIDLNQTTPPESP